jgi:hypothetical protein
MCFNAKHRATLSSKPAHKFIFSKIFARSRHVKRRKARENDCRWELTDGEVGNQIGHDYGQQHLNFAIETMTQQ